MNAIYFICSCVIHALLNFNHNSCTFGVCFHLTTSCTPLFNVVSLQFFKYFKCLYLLVPLICKKFVVIQIQNFIIVPTCMREETLQLTERIKSFVHCSCLDELNLLNRLIWSSSRLILLNSQRLTHPYCFIILFFLL